MCVTSPTQLPKAHQLCSAEKPDNIIIPPSRAGQLYFFVGKLNAVL